MSNSNGRENVGTAGERIATSSMNAVRGYQNVVELADLIGREFVMLVRLGITEH